MRAILRAPVDLLWNGGIGTYVKSGDESHADVRDRANDSVRADARELRARIVAEGGNVGFTQAARVEFALAGGRIDSDAIHNAGGVALSDHEVNFKILLAPLVGTETLPPAERSAVLRDCTAAADEAVLERCGSQSRSLSLDALRAQADPERLTQAAEFLVTHAELDPALERLPARELARSRGWTRPELAVLLGYSKRLCKRELTAAGMPAHPLLAELFRGYFPESLRERFPHELETHQLRDAITATCLVNFAVDRAGVTLVPEHCRALGVSVPAALFGWLAADRWLEAESARRAVSAAADTEATRLRALLGVEDAVAHAAALGSGPGGRRVLRAGRRAQAGRQPRGAARAPGRADPRVSRRSRARCPSRGSPSGRPRPSRVPSRSGSSSARARAFTGCSSVSRRWSSGTAGVASAPPRSPST